MRAPARVAFTLTLKEAPSTNRMQLCVSACLPVSLGGAGGSAVYIDTEGSFVADRLAEMARGTARACLARLGVSSLPRTVDLVSDAILWGIQVQRVHSAVEQIAAVHAVEDQIESLARRPVLARHDGSFSIRETIC